MITLALNMIAKNEAQRIHLALQSAAKVCDELIVVDTGSDDDTVAVAENAGARVYHYPWPDDADYSAWRNFALDLTESDWILVLDADDILDEAAVDAILKLKAHINDEVDGVLMNYLYEWEGDRCTQQFLIQRLIRRASGLRWVEPVHEYIPFPDAARVLLRPDIIVTHRPDGKDRSDRTMQIRILERAIATCTATARTWYNYGNELAFVGRHSEAIGAYHRFLFGRNGVGSGDEYMARVRVAQCKLILGQRESARAGVMDAIYLDPSRAEAYAVMGEMEYQADEYARAIPLFSAAIACTPPIEGYVQRELYGWLSHERLAICHLRAGNPELARAHHMASLADRPDVRRLHERIGRAYADDNESTATTG